MKDLTLVVEGVPITLPEAEWARIVALHNGSSRITPGTAYEIRRRYHTMPPGRRLAVLACRYGISRRTVLRIVTGETHTYVPHPPEARGYARLACNAAFYPSES